MSKDRLAYWRRIFKVYFTREKGYLSFWHEKPAISTSLETGRLGPYYMTFEDKAAYAGPRDSEGVILFDYYFDIGRQYNPLAVAQFGLGHFNLYQKNSDETHLRIAITQADWLVNNLEEAQPGLWVWRHKFRWHYKHYLEPGWYSAHSQGTGISLLARLYERTHDPRYLECARRAWAVLNQEMKNGGVKYVDEEGSVWLEEYRVDPPTHILNGFLWALWGVWDYYLLTKDEASRLLFDSCIRNLETNLQKYDIGFWSIYDLSTQLLKMVASPFYHSLHIVQLRATHFISGHKTFELYADRWASYANNPVFRILALIYKAVFKLLYF